ncbi:MAG: DUF2752 domain-containing protein [Cytophagales bacterium]|nr:DUF2752 domain-containing protein [Armatimonadota bacterium]
MPLPVDGGRSLLGLPSLCVFYATTGLPCPGCGITRSVVCCCHLRLGEALTYHPAGPLVFLWLTGAVLLRFPLPAAWRRWLHALPLSLRSGAGIALVALLFGIWGARLGGWLPSPP